MIIILIPALAGVWLLDGIITWLHGRYTTGRDTWITRRVYGTGCRVACDGRTWTVIEWENDCGPVFVKLASPSGDAFDMTWAPLDDVQPVSVPVLRPRVTRTGITFTAQRPVTLGGTS